MEFKREYIPLEEVIKESNHYWKGMGSFVPKGMNGMALQHLVEFSKEANYIPLVVFVNNSKFSYELLLKHNVVQVKNQLEAAEKMFCLLLILKPDFVEYTDDRSIHLKWNK